MNQDNVSDNRVLLRGIPGAADRLTHSELVLYRRVMNEMPNRVGLTRHLYDEMYFLIRNLGKDAVERPLSRGDQVTLFGTPSHLYIPSHFAPASGQVGDMTSTIQSAITSAARMIKLQCEADINDSVTVRGLLVRSVGGLASWRDLDLPSPAATVLLGRSNPIDATVGDEVNLFNLNHSDLPAINVFDPYAPYDPGAFSVTGVISEVLQVWFSGVEGAP